MNPRLLEQLAVPTPPYRARSPKATLAMAEDVPPQVSGEPEAPSSPYAKRDNELAAQMNERKVAEEKAKLEEHERKEWERGLGIDPEKKIAEAAEQISAAATVAKGKITSAPPIPEATPEISAQDDANKTEAVAKIEKAADNGKQRVAAARGKLIKTGTEVASDALREIHQGRRQPYQPKPDFNAERSEFDSEMNKTNRELVELEAAGKENTPAAQVLRDRIDALEAQREEITPRKKPEPTGPQVGDIVTEGKKRARVMEVGPGFLRGGR